MDNSSEPIKLVIAAPDRSSKGFLKRQRKALEIQNIQSRFAIQAARYREQGATLPDDFAENMSAAVTQLTNFILDYVVEPADRTLAAAAIEDLSELELQEVMQSIAQGATPPSALPKTSEPPTSATSATG